MTKKLLILAGVIVLTTGAHAGSFIADWNFDFSGTDYVTGGGVTNQNEYTGMFTATRTGGTTSYFGGANSSGYVLNTFCAEITETIGIPGNHTHTNVEILDGTGNQQTVMGGTVFDWTRTVRLEKLWGAADLSTAAKRAAFQVAQWNLLFDTDLTLTGGSFTAGASTVTTDAEALLNGLDSKTQLATVYLLSGAGIQDQLAGLNGVGPPPGATPEPFTMGLGLASAGMFVRRRLKAKKS